MFASDGAYVIGSTHKVCQDYARAGSTRTGGAFAIVSDGCSMSTDSDWGSRLLVIRAEETIRLGGVGTKDFALDNPQEVKTLIEQTAMTRPPVLKEDCLDATLMLAMETPEGVTVWVVGDGVVIGVLKDGSTRVWDIDYHGAPGYPSYLLSPQRWDAFVAAGYNNRFVHEWVDGTCTTSVSVVTPETLVWELKLSKEEFKGVILASDGAKSFQKNTGQGFEAIPLAEVVPYLVDLRLPKGVFVTRMIQFARKTWAKQGWEHGDDLAVAAVWME